MNATTASTLGTTKPTFWKAAREQLEAERTLKAIGEKKFKSERAAKVAYKKAENAAKEADRATSVHVQEARRTGYGDEETTDIRRLESAAQRLWDEAHAIYKSAREQGFFVYSYHFGYNATRDLIRANID